ncbi:MaoC family dehydratase [Aeromicrobium yanjiei]|uniref:Acyl dehydratase n=1 Tax=Aeromicrobium yanjiei TaxID=2662028 RepID=A0A5Q2MBX2_9ACTN|nr:MaoC family dehydratase [Aeromicrobium yanjiei]QGG40594.1 acyl dehydratase [Aeromicrobium yanjiei]
MPASDAVPDPAPTTSPTPVRGPYFDELSVGQVFDESPAVTLTAGRQATHQAIVGNRLRLSLDDTLAAEVTGHDNLVPPALVWDTSIGQSTAVTQHVKANLFYRGLSFRRFPVVGDTLRTVTTVDGLKENTRRPGRLATGLAALHIVTVDQHDRPVLDYWRCAMLPLSGDAAPEGPRDDLGVIGADPSIAALSAAVAGWDLARFRERVPGQHFADLSIGQTWRIEGADVVSSAPELARLTGNIAAVHHDAASAGGRRLVYGGHTIGLALHQAARALPAMVTVGGWYGCDHVGPVHEDDTLLSTVAVEGLDALPDGGGLAHLRVLVDATSGGAGPVPVLDWRLSAVMA